MEKEAEETRKEGRTGREEEGIITFQVHSDSRQDLHFNIHKLRASAKDNYKNYLRTENKTDCVKEFYF